MKVNAQTKCVDVLSKDLCVDDYSVLWEKFRACTFPELSCNWDWLLQHDKIKKRKQCYWLVIKMYSCVIRFSELLAQHQIELLPAMLEMMFYFLCRHAFHTTRLVIFHWGTHAAHCTQIDGLYLGPTFWMCVQKEEALKSLDLKTCPRIEIKNPTVDTPQLHLSLDKETEPLFLQVLKEFHLPCPYYSIVHHPTPTT